MAHPLFVAPHPAQPSPRNHYSTREHTLHPSGHHSGHVMIKDTMHTTPDRPDRFIRLWGLNMLLEVA